MLTSKSAIKAVLNRALAKHFPSKSQAYRADAYRTPQHAVVLISASDNPQIKHVINKLIPKDKDYEKISCDSKIVNGFSKGCLVHNFLQNRNQALQYDLTSYGPNLVVNLIMKGQSSKMAQDVRQYYHERGQLISLQWDTNRDKQSQLKQLQNRVICGYKL